MSTHPHHDTPPDPRRADSGDRTLETRLGAGQVEPGPFDDYGLTPEQIKQAEAFMARLFGEGTPYTFHRADGFYPLMLHDDDEAKANALYNPGTIKVVNEMTGQTVWSTEP